MAGSCNVLMIYPKFNPRSFWSYDGACELLGAKYPAAPLGMITLAAMLPKSWDIRLVNRNTEALDLADLDWADMVMTGGMLAQRPDCLRMIDLAHEHGKTVVIGGPDVTSSPQAYEIADIQVLGEAEIIIDEFVAAWERGERHGVFEAAKFQADITKTPIPRFDLLKQGHYIYPTVQFSRGCPFLCEFCDIIELYGRVPRTKTPEQMLAELDRLYELGWRGHLDFVDDNLIGNKKAVKEFLPHLIAWQKQRNYPFMLSTEASLNLADDSELLGLMRDANFFVVFIGIESDDEETLAHTQKKQNTRRSIPESVRRLYDYGIFAAAGFIVGFDSERRSVAPSMIRCIDDSQICIANVSLLYALAGTQLTRRLEREQRLRPDFESDRRGNAGDFALAGLNFEPTRPRRDILADFAAVLTAIYEPKSYFARARRMVLSLNRVNLGLGVLVRDSWLEFDKFLRIMWHVSRHRPEMRGRVWRLVAECLVRNPRAIRAAMSMTLFYVFLGPLTRIMAEVAEAQIAEIDAAGAAIDPAIPSPLQATAA